MFFPRHLFMFILGIAFPLCSIDMQQVLPALASPNEGFYQMVAEGNNGFGFFFYQEIKNQPGNICFSPISIDSGLAMAAAGAKGETAQEFQRAFHFSLSLLPVLGDFSQQLSNVGKKGPEIDVANAIWVQNEFPLLPSYRLTVEKELRATVQLLDFAHNLAISTQTINQWVAKQTKGKINQLLNPQDISNQTRLVLTSAIYMKGAWERPFDFKLTKRLPFHITSQRTLLADMMLTQGQFLLRKGEQWDLLVIPYEGSPAAELAMAVILPKETALSELEQQLTVENWKIWLGEAKKELVALSLPKFRIDQRIDLSTPLKGLGLSLAFTQSADFSGITGHPNLFLSKAVHKTYIKVDEKGTEAAAATGAALNLTSIVEQGQPYEFKADHPFIFVIYDQKTSLVLFLGRLAIP